MPKGIDERTGLIYLHELLPNPGDAVLLRNAGAIYEVERIELGRPDLDLTEEDIEALKTGRVVWQ